MLEVQILGKNGLLLSKPLEPKLTIGGGDKCNIKLKGEIEPFHAAIEVSDKRVIVKELGGSVYYNGQQIAGVIEAVTGGIYNVGEYRIQICRSHTSKRTFTHRTLTSIGNNAQSEHDDLIPTITFLKPRRKSFRKLSIVIGRSSSCDLALPDEGDARKFVSRRHVALNISKGRVYATDLESKNGTTLFDSPIVGIPLPLKGVLQLGRFELPYEIEPQVIDNQVGITIPSSNPNLPPKTMVGNSKAILALKNNLDRVLQHDVSVLIQGDTGTGKELCARYLHYYHSKRKSGPFIAINCAAIPKQLVESHLFGHAKGAFTGAVSQTEGIFEQANKGTLFLDEIGELPLECQGQLLRVLEDGIVRPVGATREKYVDVRVVAATNRNISELKKCGAFRSDLFHRLHTIVRIPPLKERLEDIAPLVNYFLSFSGRPMDIEDGVVDYLKEYSWPGNIRELSSTIDRAIMNSIYRGSNTIQIEDLDIALDEAEKRTKKQNIVNHLKRYRGNMSKVAEVLGIGRTTLYRKIKEHEIEAEEFR